MHFGIGASDPASLSVWLAADLLDASPRFILGKASYRLMRWRRRYGPHRKGPTPLAPVLPLFETAAELMAGQRRDVLEWYIQWKQVILTLDDEPTSDFRIDSNHEIHISLQKLERLWGTLYAYTVIYDLQKEVGFPADVTATTDGLRAKAFLDWAFGDPAAPWPEWLPRPNDGSGLSHNTDGLFRLCSGFVLLHETAHCLLGHTGNPAINPKTKIRRELAADDWAAGFVITGHPEGMPLQHWLAMAMTLGVIGALELHGEPGEVRGHPRPVHRMIHFQLNHLYPLNPNEALKSGVQMAMITPVQAHLTRLNLPGVAADATVERFWAMADMAYPS